LKGSPYLEPKYFSTEQVSRVLGISVKTLKNREARGFYPKTRRNPYSRYRQYSAEEIENLERINRDEVEIIR
jgi:DNA-binding transcriptional MerR regulator